MYRISTIDQYEGNNVQLTIASKTHTNKYYIKLFVFEVFATQDNNYTTEITNKVTPTSGMIIQEKNLTATPPGIEKIVFKK